MKALRAPAIALAVGIAILIVVRLESFTEPFLEFDEGIYLLMAREVAHGHLPYVTLFDAKPPGFYFLLGAAVRVFGTSIYVLRAIALLCVLASCAAIFAICGAFVSDKKTIAALAIAMYAGMTASVQGLAANAELILTPFVLWAFVPIVRAAATRSGIDRRRALLCGILLGIAIELKLTAGGEALFALAFALFATASAAASIAVLIAGIVLPTALVVVVYGAAGGLPSLIDANVLSLARRIGHAPRDHADLLHIAVRQARDFLPSTLLVLLTPLGMPTTSARERRLVLWLAAWLVFDVVQVFAERELYGHQFLDAMAPAAIVGAWAAIRTMRRFAPQHVLIPLASALAVFAIAFHAVPQDLRALRNLRGTGLDSRDVVMTYLQGRVAGKTFFVADDQPLFYALANEPIPDRYALFLSNASLVQLAGFDARSELDRIFATRPALVLHQNDPAIQGDEGEAIASNIEGHLARDYTQAFCSGVDCVYARKGDAR